MAAILRNVRTVGNLVASVRNTIPRLSTAAFVHHNGGSKHLHSQRQALQSSVLKVNGLHNIGFLTGSLTLTNLVWSTCMSWTALPLSQWVAFLFLTVQFKTCVFGKPRENISIDSRNQPTWPCTGATWSSLCVGTELVSMMFGNHSVRIFRCCCKVVPKTARLASQSDSAVLTGEDPWRLVDNQ